MPFPLLSEGGNTASFSNEENEYPDIIQFGSALYYCSESDGLVLIEVVRLGRDDNVCSCSYTTRDISARAGEKFEQSEGRVIFSAGETRKTIEIRLIENSTFDATLEFAVDLIEPEGAELGRYLSTCSIIIADDDAFPSNKYADLLKVDRAHECPQFLLMLEYFKSCLKDKQVFRCALRNMVTDQTRNLCVVWQVVLSKYVVDQILTDPPLPSVTDGFAPSGREGRMMLTVALSLLPHLVLLVINRMKVCRRIQGMVINQLQGNLVRKFLHYDEQSHQQVSTADLVMAIARDVPELVENGFMGFFLLVQSAGLVLVFIIMYLTQTTDRKGWILTLSFFVAIPLIMLLFVCCRHAGTHHRDQVVFQAQTDMLMLVHQITDHLRLIADYGQKPDMVVEFQHRVHACNKANTSAALYRVANMEFAPFVASVATGIYALLTYQDVLDLSMPLGQFLMGISVWRTVGGAYQKLYTDMLQIQQAAAPLLNIAHYMNLPVDTYTKMDIIKVLQSKSRASESLAHAQLFGDAHANSSLVRNTASVPCNGGFVKAIYPVDILQIFAANISFSYPSGNITILNDATFTIPQGHLVAVSGNRGCGKKTLLELIASVLLPSSHALSKEFLMFVPPHLRVLHVTKEPQHLPQNSLFENLTFGPSGGEDESSQRVMAICRRIGLSKDTLQLVAESCMAAKTTKSKVSIAQEMREVAEVNAEQAALDQACAGSPQSIVEREKQKAALSREGRLPHTEKVLLNFARAFIMNPEVLIIHKPLDHFDNLHARRVVELLKEFVDCRGLEKPPEELNLRRPRTCIFSVSSTDDVVDVDILLEMRDFKINQIDVAALSKFRTGVGKLAQLLDKKADGLLAREEFMALADEAPKFMEVFGIEPNLQRDDARQELSRVFDLVDEGASGAIDREELSCFLLAAFNRDLQEAASAMENPVGAAAKIKALKASGANSHQSPSNGGHIVDAWDAPEIPLAPSKICFPSSPSKLPPIN
eukprot:TRINITY_DN72142_c0_g1_i1.p1 TRINITY_DN72142_c0_g1~~TRINITY_DN72142_c0_g1_i1.p1  ORF type:complete len:990 (+),score=145.86 TRINITY_DN72142_c0_g1_i1:90-3059(+)